MNRFLRKLSLVASVVLLASMFVACNKDDPNDEPIVTTQVSKIHGEEVEGNFGEQTENENIGITLKNVYRLDIPEYDGNIYIAFNLEIQNNSDSEQSFDAIRDFCLKLNGDDTLLYDELIQPNALLYIKENTNFNRISGTVAPGTLLDGVVTAMVPKDFASATLVCYTNYTTTTGSIDFTITPDQLEDCPVNN